MACQWCGDQHGADQLCQRAQRGMTRRSFCFLFGAGVAGLALAGSTPAVEAWYVDASGRLHVQQADKWTTIDESIYYPTVATFKTRNRLSLGQYVRIEHRGLPVFDGRVAKWQERRTLDPLTGVVTTSVEVTAVDHIGFTDSRQPRSGPFAMIDRAYIHD